MTDISNKDKLKSPVITTEVSLEIPDRKLRIPRKVIHFSDGVLEEYSTDDEEVTKAVESLTPTVDPKSLTWLPWLRHYVYIFSANSFFYADKCGEKLAWFFGITSPKYQREINEYYRLKAEEEEERLEEEQYQNKQTHIKGTDGKESTDLTGLVTSQKGIPNYGSY